jgi:hypothetical protein
MLEITRLYNEEDFPENEPCLGYSINVWQESINQEFAEYLVNYKYLVKLMERYGFVLISSEEANKIGLKSGSGLFESLFKTMTDNLKSIKTKFGNTLDAALNMSEAEKNISFMNRYFIFKKNLTVDAKKVQKDMNEEMTNQSPELHFDNIRIKKIGQKIIIKEKESNNGNDNTYLNVEPKEPDEPPIIYRKIMVNKKNKKKTIEK